MEADNTVCPVCTLYLRPGITLKAHLASHPKHKVIEALVRLSSHEGNPKEIVVASSEPPGDFSQRSSSVSGSWSQGNSVLVNNVAPTFGTVSTNHSFIYHQFMSTSSQQPPNVLNVNPLTQQYVSIPTVINPQVMCQPYMYQQQQVIMGTGPSVVPSAQKTIAVDPSKQTAISVSTFTDTASISDDKLDEPSNQSELVEVRNENVDLTENNCSSNDEEISSSLQQTKYMSKKEMEKEEQIVSVPSSPADTSNDKNVLNENIEGEICDKIDIIEMHLVDQEGKVNKELQEFQDHEDILGSPRSSVGSDYHLRVRTDLSKACQTQQMSNSVSQPGSPQDMQEDTAIENHFDDGFFLESEQSAQQTVVTSANVSLPSTSESTSTVYTSPTGASSVSQPNQLIDIDGMQLMLPGDFMSGQLISQVEDFECINNRSDRRVLMTLGTIDGSRETFVEQREFEETLSHESTNVSIRADERMPPRGELSGQESNGATSDITWSRVHYHEGSSGMSTSYDFLVRETWEGSDGSDNELPPLQSRMPQHVRYSPDIDDNPTIVSVTEPPLNFKCSICGEAFKCPKERRVHHSEKHTEVSDSTKPKNPKVVTGVGSKLGSKRVKKLTIKPKQTEIKAETNFDNVFTNKLKLETNIDANIVQQISEIPVAQIDEDELKDCELGDKIKSDLACVCSLCNIILPNTKLLKQHKHQIHNIGPGIRYKCNTCDETFPSEQKYSEHLIIHPLECRLCGKYFFRRQNMALHMKRHLGIKPYKCNFCEKSFLTKQKHDEHKNIHTGEAPIKCTMCDETFRRHSNLVQHRNRYHLNIKKKVKDYICFCGDIFHSKKKLAWHKEIHDAKPKACIHCSEKFIHMASLTRHMRRAHNERYVPKEERNTENVECPICKGVYLRSSLDVHIRNHSGQKPYTCLICNKDFTTKWNLKLHKWTHAARTSKPFKCDQCKGAFIRETDYIAHMNSHKSVRPYTCNYCGAQFIRKYNCQRHVREHERGKTFACQVCGKSFHRSYYLKDHMRVHSGLRPYACHICGKTSTTKSNHNKHVRIHHAREPISTEN